MDNFSPSLATDSPEIPEMSFQCCARFSRSEVVLCSPCLHLRNALAEDLKTLDQHLGARSR